MWTLPLLALGVLSGCGGGSPDATSSETAAASPLAGATEAAALQSLDFTTSDAAFINPERGFHAGAYLTRDITGRTSDYAFVRRSGASFVRGIVRMDNYRDRDLSDEFLQDLRTSFNQIRKAGIKVVPLFMYNFPVTVDASGAIDAPIDRVERHIAQLAPVFAEHEDVIMGLHGGFIGAWGEWHSSSNGLTSPENKRRVLRALLGAMPKSRWVQLRLPADTVDFFPTPLNEATAFAATDAARIGFSNQCFVTNATDAGTWYDRNGVDTPALRNYMAETSRYMSVGGETCQVEPDAYKQPSGCDNTIAELTRYHWSFLNADFYEPTLQRWKSEGCYDTIAKRLGYRFELQNAQVQQAVRPGGELRVDFSIRNSGFAGPSNARDLQIVLRRRADGALLRVDWADRADPRRWFAGDAPHAVSITAGIPANATPGDYDVLLNLPDPGRWLKDSSDYSIRIASTQSGRDVWESATGFNQLFSTVTIDAAAAGAAYTGDRWFR
jgi:Domain of unknown function (DUF4832)/Domain of unknown function (DUF4874)